MPERLQFVLLLVTDPGIDQVVREDVTLGEELVVPPQLLKRVL